MLTSLPAMVIVGQIIEKLFLFIHKCQWLDQAPTKSALVQPPTRTLCDLHNRSVYLIQPLR